MLRFLPIQIVMMLGLAGVGSLSTLAAPTLPTTGKILRLVNGDLMCYVTLLDAQRKKHTLGADFEVCASQKLVHKKVRLIYKWSRVSDCQSAEPCDKSRSIMLITNMRMIK
jgi:hypothetical protein